VKRIALALALTALTALPALAQLPDVPMGKWWKRPRIVEQLKIQPDQQERLEEIFSKNRRAFIDLKADVDRRAVDLEELMAKKDTEPKKISTAVEALEQAKSRLGKARTMMVVDMKQVLSAEQWQTILDLRSQWRDERGDDRRLPRRGPQARPDRPEKDGQKD